MHTIAYGYLDRKLIKFSTVLILLFCLFLTRGCAEDDDYSAPPGDDKKIFREKMPQASVPEKITMESVSDKEPEDEKKRPDPPLSLKNDVLIKMIPKQAKGDEIKENVLQEIREIRFETLSGGEEQVLFLMKGTEKKDLFALDGTPPRIVCDFFAAKIAGTVNKSIDLNGKIIRKIRIGIHEGSEPRVRVVLDLSARETGDYEVQPVSYEDVNIYAIIVK